MSNENEQYLTKVYDKTLQTTDDTMLEGMAKVSTSIRIPETTQPKKKLDSDKPTD